MPIINFTPADVLRNRNLENEKWYSWVIKEIKAPTPSKDKQSVNTALVLSLIDSDSDLDGKEIIRMYNSKAPSMWLSIVAAARGIPMSELPKEGFQVDTDELVGKKVDGKYVLETYEGQLQGRVETYLPYKSAAGQAGTF